MARTRKQTDTDTTTATEAAEPTGTVQARRKAERARQREVDKLRAHHQAELEAARKATAKRLADKPTDTRTLVDPDPVANL